jgi:hypothetical protein
MSYPYSHKQTHYIIGIGRSGTTLLSKLLNQHKNCLVTLETDFVIFFHHSFKDKTSFSNTDYKLVADYFELFFKLNPTVEPYFQNLNLFQDLCSTNITSYQELINFIYLRFNFLQKPLQDIKIIIDKKPSYSLHVDELLKLNPETKFIYLVRDYRANILSRKQSIESRSPNIAFNAYRWLFFNKKISSFKKLYPNKILEIKYEELATNTNETLKNIIQFLNLSNNEQDFLFYKDIPLHTTQFDSKNTLLNQRIKKTREDLEKPVFKSRIDAWKEQLTEQEIKLSEAICENYAQKIGYTSIMNLNWLNKFILNIKEFNPFIKAIYDYQKEFILIHLKAETKLKRIKAKFKII